MFIYYILFAGRDEKSQTHIAINRANSKWHKIESDIKTRLFVANVWSFSRKSIIFNILRWYVWWESLSFSDKEIYLKLVIGITINCKLTNIIIFFFVAVGLY